MNSLQKAGMRGFILAAALQASACLLSDSINQPPLRPVIEGPSELSRGTKFVYTVQATDLDGEQLAVYWGQSPGACEVNPPSFSPGPLGTTAQEVNEMNLGPMCLWVLVRDPRGAEATASRTVLVTNVRPVALLKGLGNVLQPEQFQLYGIARVSGKSSFDADDTVIGKYDWSYTTPNGAAIVGRPCDDTPDGSDLCFVPEAGAGLYGVTLVVTDPIGGVSEPGVLSVVISPDRPPCLRETEPGGALRLRRFDEAVTLTVAVDDDGDPIPPRPDEPSQAQLVWSYRKVDVTGSSAFVPKAGADRSPQPSFHLPAGYIQGDEVQIRVEVQDRVARQSVCAPDAEVCENTPGSGCFQRMTWKVRYVL